MLIVVRAPRYKLFFYFVLSLIMVAGSAWLALFPWVLFPVKVVGLIGILFFGLCGGWILAKLFSKRISLVLDREGLLDNSSALPAGRIPWDQIARMGIMKVENQRFLGIDVRDRTLLPSSASAFRKWAEDFNLAVSGYPLGIPSTTIDRTLEELHDLIARYWKDPKARTELDLYDPAARIG